MDFFDSILRILITKPSIFSLILIWRVIKVQSSSKLLIRVSKISWLFLIQLTQPIMWPGLLIGIVFWSNFSYFVWSSWMIAALIILRVFMRNYLGILGWSLIRFSRMLSVICWVGWCVLIRILFTLLMKSNKNNKNENICCRNCKKKIWIFIIIFEIFLN